MHWLSLAEIGSQQPGGKGAFHYVTFSLLLDIVWISDHFHVYSKVKYIKFINEILLFLAQLFANCFMPATMLGYHNHFNLATMCLFLRNRSLSVNKESEI